MSARYFNSTPDARLSCESLDMLLQYQKPADTAKATTASMAKTRLLRRRGTWTAGTGLTGTISATSSMRLLAAAVYPRKRPACQDGPAPAICPAISAGVDCSVTGTRRHSLRLRNQVHCRLANCRV